MMHSAITVIMALNSSLGQHHFVSINYRVFWSALAWPHILLVWCYLAISGIRKLPGFHIGYIVDWNSLIWFDWLVTSEVGFVHFSSFPLIIYTSSHQYINCCFSTPVKRLLELPNLITELFITEAEVSCFNYIELSVHWTFQIIYLYFIFFYFPP